MSKPYFFELATAFWINLSAGYFLTIAISTTIEGEINAFILTVICATLAYLSRTLQK